MLSGARAAISSLKHSDPAIVIARSTTTHSSGPGHTWQPASKKRRPTDPANTQQTLRKCLTHPATNAQPPPRSITTPIQPTPNNLSGNVPSAPQETCPRHLRKRAPSAPTRFPQRRDCLISVDGVINSFSLGEKVRLRGNAVDNGVGANEQLFPAEQHSPSPQPSP